MDGKGNRGMGSNQNLKNDGFFEINISALKDNTLSHFDVYTDVEHQLLGAAPSQPLLYAKAPYDWTYREINQLSSAGLSCLFVREDDRKRFQRYLRINEPVPEVDSNLEARFRIRQVEEIGAHLIETAFLTDISENLVGQLRSVSNDLVDCVTEDPRSILELKSLADHDMYTYIHSVGVGSLTTAIALQLGITKTNELRDYAYGGLLHDIGKKLLPLALLNKPGPLAPHEWEAMKTHPDNGAKLLEEFTLPEKTIEMVTLHHEKLDGSGYPGGLTKASIPLHVQVATVADIYNALTTTRCYHRKRTRFEALMFMKHHLKGKISAEVFDALVRCLANEEQVKAKAAGGA
jgi:putative nucleotidyltransferase with HDIG domain